MATSLSTNLRNEVRVLKKLYIKQKRPRLTTLLNSKRNYSGPFQIEAKRQLGNKLQTKSGFPRKPCREPSKYDRIKSATYAYMLFAGWEVRMLTNCDRGLENAALGLGQHFKISVTVFHHTDRP